MWDAGSPMHSDIDLLVVTAEALPSETAEQLVNETYPLYLECGRQIGPQFRSAGELSQSQGERAAVFAENLARTGSSWPSEEAGAQAAQGRQAVARAQLASDDPAIDQVDDLAVEKAARFLVDGQHGEAPNCVRHISEKLALL